MSQASPAKTKPGAPLRLQLERLKIDASVVSVEAAPDGSLGVPEDVHVLGWWRDGAKPGSLAGTVVVDGHVDGKRQGKGALFHLQDAILGDVITLTMSTGDVRYVVAARRSYLKPDLPAEAFSTTGRPRLVLITCGGAFDRTTHHYASNVVVYGLPVT